MQSIRQMLIKFEKLDTERMITDAVRVTQEKILEYNKDQMFHGRNANDTKIGVYQNTEYAVEKHAQNPLPGLGNVDLFRTGAFYTGMNITISGRTFQITSTDSKTVKLFQNYLNIFGLGPIAKRMYIANFLLKAAAEARRNQVGI